MNGQQQRQRLKQMAAGSTRTPGHHPDYDKFMHAAARALLKGDPIIAGILHVEASNAETRANMKKAHCPNLGPYTDSDPAHCIHCNSPKDQWVKDEACVTT